MANAELTDDHAPSTAGRTEYRFYLLLLFPVFLIAALIGRIFPSKRAHNGRRSVFREAADMAHSVIPWVFTGR